MCFKLMARNIEKSFYIISLIMMFTMTAEISAKPFTAYPGKYKATLISVESANIIHLSAEVWTGYPKKIRITLPGIDVPELQSDAPSCQIKLVQQAFDLTSEFLTQAKHIEVQDIEMENTQDQDGSSHIYTDSGSLVSALLKKGLARSSSTKKEKPWC